MFVNTQAFNQPDPRDGTLIISSLYPSSETSLLILSLVAAAAVAAAAAAAVVVVAATAAAATPTLENIASISILHHFSLS
ncbi:hypothetical protein ElyMa_005254500 [Elysia marginata]|uniref:Uncharacterized protein n=1 Tax=Elysia marginata TaxID=1093978 RepID=A0AAV4JZZ7_9GAST|nr:hypothetical protein ElyMa_005254500 [Elysia marginata]